MSRPRKGSGKRSPTGDIGPARGPVSHLFMALHGLTARGRAFLAGGITSTAAGVLLDQRDLVRIGTLLLVLPLTSAIFLTKARYRISAQRRVDRARAEAGHGVRVDVEVQNLSRFTTPLLLAQDALPPELGGSANGGARFVVQRVPAGERRSVSYVMHPTRRGRFPVGPLSVRLTDPFGFCQIVRTFSAVDRVTVMPAITPLSAGRLGGQWSAGGDGRSRGLASGGEQDATTRPYRPGDDRRRVHWRTTARIGELSVRREEQPWQSRATLLIDARAAAHSPGNPSGSFEYAVSATASIGAALLRSNFALRLVDDIARIVAQSHTTPGEAGYAVSEALAEIERGDNATLLPVTTRLQDQLTSRGAVVAVLGRLSPGDASALAQSSPDGLRRLAVLIDADAWGPAGAAAPGSVERSRDLLRQAGWAVAIARPQTSIDAVWSELTAGVRSATSSYAQRWVG